MMADTSAMKNEIEFWVRKVGLPERLGFDGMQFTGQNLALSSGGEFAFDAVDKDKTVAVCISAGNSTNPGATNKIFKDALFLLLAKESVKRRILVFTGEALFNRFKREQKEGRMPKEIELMHVKLPDDLQSTADEVGRNSRREQKGASAGG